MRRKQKLTGHQKQLRNFTVFFVVLFALVITALIWFLNSAFVRGH